MFYFSPKFPNEIRKKKFKSNKKQKHKKSKEVIPANFSHDAEYIAQDDPIVVKERKIFKALT
jgi:hypothetical protein